MSITSNTSITSSDVTGCDTLDVSLAVKITRGIPINVICDILINTICDTLINIICDILINIISDILNNINCNILINIICDIIINVICDILMRQLRIPRVDSRRGAYSERLMPSTLAIPHTPLVGTRNLWGPASGETTALRTSTSGTSRLSCRPYCRNALNAGTGSHTITLASPHHPAFLTA